MDGENLDVLKQHPASSAQLSYQLKNANVYVSAHGFHFIDYLDPVGEFSTEIDAAQLTDQESAYI